MTSQIQLKCSEERPICAQCVKANRQCIPSSGITFRHQQNPSLNAPGRGEDNLKSFYGYKETFGQGTVWVDIPRDLKFVHTSNPYEEDESQADLAGRAENLGDAARANSLVALAEDASRYEQRHEYELQRSGYSNYATHGLEALSAVASQDQYSYAPPPAPMDHGDQAPPTASTNVMSPQHSHTAPSQHSNNLDLILNHSSAGTPIDNNIDPRLHTETPVNIGHAPPPAQIPQVQRQQHTPTYVRNPSYAQIFGGPRLHTKGSHGRKPSIDDPELSFLMRDYSERSGLWMDLFDLNLFFATRVPVLAVRCPLLLYSCAALSAKSLARVDGRKPTMGGQVTPTRKSSMESWPGSALDAKGWVHKAREYYDLAVSLLRQALAGAQRSPSLATPEDISSQVLHVTQCPPLPTTDSDELVAATAILCVYEFLDASGPEWSRHLDGAKSLFDVAKDRMVPLNLPPSPVSVAPQATHHFPENLLSHNSPPLQRDLSEGRKAVFWNFARQDMLSAFINNTSTRLDTSDLAMWRSAGLRLTPSGYICPSNPTHPEYVPENAMPDDTICNALVWLIMKLVNFISAGDDVPKAMSPLGLGVRQRELLQYWEMLDDQLKVWFGGLPESFHATAALPANSPGGLQEQWFPRPMCASAMQSYHFARIQLLLNKPHLTTATQCFPAKSFGLSGENRNLPGSSLAARHASYASILAQSRSHAKDIVAIGLGRSDEGARIHSVQPLWTAGLVLGGSAEYGEDVDEETEVWRRAIVSQLRGIERDMGWASEYRIRNLLDLWGLPYDWGLSEETA